MMQRTETRKIQIAILPDSFSSSSQKHALCQKAYLACWCAVLVFIVVWTAAPIGAQTITTNDVSFALPDLGGISLNADGSGSVTAGYATIQPDSGKTAPSGVAVIGFRRDNVLVDEFSIPAGLSLQNGRIYAEVGGSIDTGIAIANPNNQTATISFRFTDSNGNDVDFGTMVIAANTQLTAFLDQAPFSSGNIQGTFTFSSNVPVAGVGLRLFTNERGDPLFTTLPVLDMSITPGNAPAVLPQFIDANGSTTQVVLVNPGNTTITGNMQFRDQNGQAVTVTANGQTGSTFPYSIPKGSSFKLLTAGTGSSSGSIQVTPDTGNTTPMSQAILSYKSGGITTSSSSTWFDSGVALRTFVEAAGSFGDSGSMEDGVAITNVSSSPSTFTFSLSGLDGVSQGSPSLEIAANGQAAVFLRDIFPSLPTSFQGVLRITASGSLMSVAGLRGRYNERGDFLLTSAPPVNELMVATSATTLFPHFANGGGFTAEFNLFSGSAGQATSGHLRFYKQDGSPVSLTLSGLPKKRRGQIISQ
jgi:hypothetical protein